MHFHSHDAGGNIGTNERTDARQAVNESAGVDLDSDFSDPERRRTIDGTDIGLFAYVIGQNAQENVHHGGVAGSGNSRHVGAAQAELLLQFLDKGIDVGSDGLLKAG